MDSSDNDFPEEDSQKFSQTDDLEEKPFTSPSSSKNISSSVQEFLKQSNEIQEEIRKLSELCQQISPKKDSFVDETGQSKEEYEEENYWNKVNTMLETHGFSPVVMIEEEYNQDVPDVNSLSDTLVDVITEYSNLARMHTEMQSEYSKLEIENKELQNVAGKAKKLESQYKDLDKINRQLQEKLSKNHQESRGKEETRGKYNPRPSNEKTANIFKSFMEQDYSPMRDSDAKVMGLIQNYEEQKGKILSELSNYKRENEELKNLLKRSKERKHEEKPRSEYMENYEIESEKNKILASVVKQLQLKNYAEIPNAINKIQQVLLTLPGIDKLVKQICEVITLNPVSGLEEVLGTLQEIMKQRKNLDKFKLAVCESLSTNNEHDVFEKLKGLQYFCKLFEVKQKDDVIGVVEGIFYFVHEIKMFLAVSFM